MNFDTNKTSLRWRRPPWEKVAERGEGAAAEKRRALEEGCLALCITLTEVGTIGGLCVSATLPTPNNPNSLGASVASFTSI